LIKHGGKSNDASSIKVFGGSKCCATVYQNGDFTGWKARFKPGQYPMNKFLAQGARVYDFASIVVSNKVASVKHHLWFL